MFIIAHNDSVILGPMRWNRYRFENEIQEECEIAATLPDLNTSSVISVSDDVKIYPVIATVHEQFNPRTQHLHGPFWTFTEDGATASYIAQDLPVESVKSSMKAEVANQRWVKESAGFSMTVQGVEVRIDTSRGNRDVFVQKYLLMADEEVSQWKFNDTWIALSKQDMMAIVSAINSHVQAQFDWEAGKIAEIDQCITLEQLDAIVIIDPVETE